jgi:hypothetical protein
MKTITARIEGTTSLIQHRFSEQAESDSTKTTRLVGNSRGTPREEAEKVTYRFPDGSLYHPGAAISRLLREAGSNHKIKGTRKSVKFAVPSAVIVLDDAIALEMPGSGEAISDYEVDSRPVVIPSTKGRVMRHRPRLDKWAMTFHLEIDDDLLPVEFVHQLLEEGGRKLGIGDFRPEKGGPFGRFAVTSWTNGNGNGK